MATTGEANRSDDRNESVAWDSLGRHVLAVVMTILVGMLIWTHERSRLREADMNRRLKTLADAYTQQRGSRRELYFARLEIDRLRAELRGHLADSDAGGLP